MKVISNHLSEYVLLDLVTKKEKNIHVKRIKQFHFSPTADPLDIARRDYLEFLSKKFYLIEAMLKRFPPFNFSLSGKATQTRPILGSLGLIYVWSLHCMNTFALINYQDLFQPRFPLQLRRKFCCYLFRNS